jgi:hypothetical protein
MFCHLPKIVQKHLSNRNNPDWKFAEEYDPATYDVYGFEAIPSLANSLEQQFPKVHPLIIKTLIDIDEYLKSFKTHTP